MTGATLPLAAIRVGERHRKDVGDLDSLARSIADIGLLHPVVVRPDGLLVAGERRLSAAKRLGWESIPVTVVDLDAVVRGELAENAERKDFLPSEIDAIRRALEPLEKEAARARMSEAARAGKLSTPSAAGKARDRIGAFAGVSGRIVEKIAKVVEAAEAEPERFGKLLADMDRTGQVNGVFKRLRVSQQAALIRAEPPPLPGGRYRVIAADPPWPYEKRAEDPSHRATYDYPSMSIAAICALPVPTLAEEDSILWLWTTNHHMEEAFGVVRAWGFEQKTILTWGKDKFGTGDWLRGQTEHCLMAVRGHSVVTLTNQSTLLRGPVRAHSQKPEAFYELVEGLCPAPRYLELFSRQQRPGWDSWGNDADKFLPLTPEEDAADSLASYNAAITGIGEQVRAGAEVPGFLLSRRGGAAS